MYILGKIIFRWVGTSHPVSLPIGKIRHTSSEKLNDGPGTLQSFTVQLQSVCHSNEQIPLKTFVLDKGGEIFVVILGGIGRNF